MEMHPVVRAAIRLHVAQSERDLVLLESQARTIPATQRSNNHMLHLAKKIKEKRAIAESWYAVLTATEE